MLFPEAVSNVSVVSSGDCGVEGASEMIVALTISVLRFPCCFRGFKEHHEGREYFSLKDSAREIAIGSNVLAEEVGPSDDGRQQLE